MPLQLKLTALQDLLASLPQLYWDIKRLAGFYRPKDRETNTRTLDEAMDVISREEPLASWSPYLCQRFVMTACALAREALLAGPSPESPTPAGMLTAEQRADLLCSFAAAADQLPLMGKLQAGSVRVMTQLDGGPPLEDPQVALAEALAALAPLRLPADEAHDQVRAQIVLHVGRRIETGQRLAPAVEEVARQWCHDLLERGQLVTILHRAARNLGVNVPQRVPSYANFDRPREERFRVTPPPAVEADGPRPQAAPPEPPTIWKTPDEISPQARQQEYLACLLKLQALARDKNGPITSRTAESLYDLGPESDPLAASKAMYFAARELWKSYTQVGVAPHLDLARRAALLAYRGAPLEGERRERAGALYLWMNTQLPNLLQERDLNELITDAHRLYAHAGCRAGELYLRQGLVEAHAGVCRQRAREGDDQARGRLLEKNGPALQVIHQEYLRQAAGTNYRPSEDALAAWDYLYPADPATGGQGGGGSPSRILADPAFREVIRRGSPEGVYQFVEAHYQEIRDAQLERLDVHISPDHLLWPEGTIRNPRSTDLKVPDPAFLAARTLLEERNFADARLAFNRLAERVQVRGAVNRPREICRNYEAYSWARQGEPTFARNCLKELITADFPFPSAYWNYACCLPEEEKDSQLGVLLKGLERAPHVLSLHGVIHLGLQLDDRPRLREWLPCLASTEALLLAFFLEYDHLGVEARDQPVLRLAQYVMDGVEPRMPDPVSTELRSSDVNDFLHMLLDRHLDRAAEFWLRCREQEPSVRFRFDFWESKADFLDAIRRRPQAAAAFREEMRCRLNLIRSGKFKGPHILHTTRRRLEQWLVQCMTPELQAIGQDLFTMVEQFERQSSHHPGLLPRLPGVRSFYREAESRARGNGPPSPPSYQPGERPARHLKIVPKSAIPTAQATARPNDRRPGGTRLPDLLADSLEEGRPTGIDLSAPQTAFAVYVGIADDDNEPVSFGPVRIREARVTLSDGKRLPLRDQLDALPVIVETDRPAILTFETVPGLQLPQTVTVALKFEMGGALYDAEPSKIDLQSQACPGFPESPPYIYSRPLLPNEVPGRFFGRETEQAAIFDSLPRKQLRYVEGIRGIGKSSFLRSIEFEIGRRKLPYLPVYWSAAGAPAVDHVGAILHGIFAEAAKHPELAASEVEVPDEQRCKENLSSAYDQFAQALAAKLGGRQVLVLADDLQVLVEQAHSAADSNPTLTQGIRGLLDLVADRATRDDAPIAWLLAGQCALDDCRRLLSDALLWSAARPLALDFLDRDAVGQVLSTPLAGTSVIAPPETEERLHEMTAGHPQVVQHLSAEMLRRAQAEKRAVLTPEDAYAAARELADHRESFTDAWYPVAELSQEQRSLVEAFVNAVPLGERIDPCKLAPGGRDDAQGRAIEGLVQRKILDQRPDGTIGIKALVLDWWLHKAVPELKTEPFNAVPYQEAP